MNDKKKLENKMFDLRQKIIKYSGDVDGIFSRDIYDLMQSDFEKLRKEYNEKYPVKYDIDDFYDFEVDGIDYSDYPDFCDAYICAASIGDREATEDELDFINENYPDLVYELVIENLY